MLVRDVEVAHGREELYVLALVHLHYIVEFVEEVLLEHLPALQAHFPLRNRGQAGDRLVFNCFLGVFLGLLGALFAARGFHQGFVGLGAFSVVLRVRKNRLQARPARFEVYPLGSPEAARFPGFPR